MTVNLVTGLSRSWERDRSLLANDPWIDQELALRMNARTRWLLSTVLNPGKLLLAPAEAALLVIFPFMYEAFWAYQAAKRVHVLLDEDRPPDLHHEYVRFEQFQAGYSRLLRRATRAVEDDKVAAADAIEWWLFHQWLLRQVDCYEADDLFRLLHEHAANRVIDEDPLTAQLFNPLRLAELLRNVSAGIDYVAGSDRPGSLAPVRIVASATDAEQPVREQLIGYLTAVAYRFTIDARVLPEMIVDHLGISYEVSLKQMHETIRSAAWDARGRTRVLTASCKHPSVELALREHAAGVGELLGQIENDASSGGYLDPLVDMPTHATADRVVSHVTSDGRRAYDSSDLRFRLAEDRIQELLMGEQLYGDPRLAIRELYQNALDACRYREARSEFLRMGGAHLPDWRGNITFRQGHDSAGRPYLDCQDNGIGMGLRELGAVFARAGIRFSDLPEYIEERASWRSAGIEMFPNSRFGIGVLSYFMLADDITVTTCRMNRAGRPGDILEVHIAGPGALFRVHNLGPGSDAGTTIRLHLRDKNTDLAITDFLRSILVISDYDVKVSDLADSETWTSHQLFTSRIQRDNRPGGPEESYLVDPTETPDAWWVNADGYMLADGLQTGGGMFAAIVNLSGPHMPVLTVDRKRVLWYDERHVTNLLHSQIPALFADGAEVLTPKWLSTLAGVRPRLADEIFDRALELWRRPWVVAGADVPISTVGCFGADEHLFAGISDSPTLQEDDDTPWYAKRERFVPTLTAAHIRRAPEISRWRFLAWAQANRFPGVTVSEAAGNVILARPSDDILADTLSGLDWRRTSPHRSVPLGLVAYVAERVARSPSEIASRLSALGFAVPDPMVLAEPVGDDVPLLMYNQLSRSSYSGSWLDPSLPVPLGHLIDVARRCQISVMSAASRLEQLGFSVPDAKSLPEEVDDRDLALLAPFRRVDSGRNARRWISADETVSVGHILAMAENTGLAIHAVEHRMRKLGFKTPDTAYLPRQIDPEDRFLISRDGDGYEPWLSGREIVPLGHLGHMAHLSKRTVHEVCDRLGYLGFRTPDLLNVPEQLSEDDLIFLSYGRTRSLGNQNPWLDPGTLVPIGHLVIAAAMTGHSVADVAARLDAFGFITPPPDTLPRRLSGHDLRILSATFSDRRFEDPLDFTQPVALGHLAASAIITGQRISKVAARLAALGYATPDPRQLPARADWEAVRILSERFDGSRPWLTLGEPIPYEYLAVVARQGRKIPDIASRLATFGFQLPGELVITEPVPSW